MNETPRRRSSAALAALLLAPWLALPALAQSGGPYDLSWSTIDAGGIITAAGGPYSIDGTLGQPDAGQLTGGTYVLGGGFWSGGGTFVVGVGDPERAPTVDESLSPGTPNPFSLRTRMAFAVARAQRVALRVFDLRGARVRTLLDEEVAAGRHTLSWDGTDDGGRRVANGVYLVRLSGRDLETTGKVVLLRP